MTKTKSKILPVTSTLKVEVPLLLASGQELENIKICYTTYGRMNATKSNVVWVFHALTANSNPVEWWPGLIGENEVINPEKHFIICANMLGSCYGTTGPKNMQFPQITISDMVALHRILCSHLEIDQIYLGIGGSMGGQQLLEWAVQEPSMFTHIVPMATNAVHSAWGIAFNEAQRMALENIDSARGIETARAIAMLSYRHYDGYEARQTDVDERWNGFSAASYQRYQGEKLRKRFTLPSYYYLSQAMDSHHLGRHYVSIESALSRIQSRALVIGLDTDILFPPQEQALLAKHIPNAELAIIPTLFGHDGFLVEAQKITNLINTFLS